MAKFQINELKKFLKKARFFRDLSPFAHFGALKTGFFRKIKRNFSKKQKTLAESPYQAVYCKNLCIKNFD
jgi:hypothetical protein